MTRKTKKVSVSPLPKGLQWPAPNEPLNMDYARLAVNLGNAEILARYLRKYRDPIVRAIADMLDPRKNINKIRLVPKRPKGRPRESNIRKAIKSAIIEMQLTEKLTGIPLGTRGHTKKATSEIAQESGRNKVRGKSVRNIFRRLNFSKR
jgi:hypothetical protein